MAKEKPVDATRFSEYGSIPLTEVRAHRDYDQATDTILVPKSIADRFAAQDAVAELKRTLGAQLLPPLAKVAALVDRLVERFSTH